MLPKENRLKKEKEFRRVGAGRSRFRGIGLLVAYGIRGEGPAKIGIVVSKKTARQAVARNRIRRVLREIARQELPRLKPGVDIVVIALPEFNAEDFTKAQKEVQKLFIKASLFQ